MYAMQYGQNLERIIKEVVISKPALVPVHVLKSDVSDGFYCIGLHPTDAPNLGLVFPSEREDEELLSIPLTHHIGWETCHPYFARRQRQWQI